MSNHKSNANFGRAVNNDADEAVDGTVLNEDGTEVITKTDKLKAFAKKHKVWFVAFGAGVLGFVAHGFLGRPDDCEVEFEPYDESEDSVDSEEE